MAKAKVTELKPINRKLITVRIIGISPLIQHKWSEKAKEMMRLKQQTGKKTRSREIREPDVEGREAGYYTEDGKPGLLAVALKAAIIEAAHQDLGIPKTLVRKALFVYPPGRESIVPLEVPNGKGTPKQNIRGDSVPVGKIEEDLVRVGQGSADLRYRPYYHEWAATTRWELDIDMLQTEDFITLLERAGYGVGIHEWRPEKGGEFGRFRIDDKFQVKEEPLK